MTRTCLTKTTIGAAWEGTASAVPHIAMDLVWGFTKTARSAPRAACPEPSRRAAGRRVAHGRLRSGASSAACGSHRSIWLSLFGAILLSALLTSAPSPSAAQARDYLTETEANKIRDADLPFLRIKLFTEFAADRFVKFKYELSRGRPDRQRNIRLRSLLDGYMGCLEDATELVQIGRMRQQDIHKGMEELEKRATEILAEMSALENSTPADAAYKDDLHEAVLTTKEALAEVARAKEEIAPPPVRRKP